MPYKMPLRREKAAKRLASALKVHGALIAERLEPRMTAVLEEGEELPDVAHLLDVLGRVVMRESAGLDAANRSRAREGAQVRRIRKQLRERVEPELRSRVVEVRGHMRQHFGAKETHLLLSHEGRTPRGLEDLSNVWTSLELSYRLSVAYEVSVVQIESARPRRYPRPVQELPADLQQIVEDNK